jgi:hypothetical protein
MRPAQKVRHGRTFWISQIKLSHPNHIAPAKPPPMPQRQIPTQLRQQPLPVLRSHLAALLKFDNIPPNLLLYKLSSI